MVTLQRGAGLLLVAPLWLWWAIWRGGWPTTVWAPGLVYLAAATAVLAATLPLERPRGARAVALGAIGVLTALSALSILWSADPGSAWEGAGRAALYMLSLALPILWPPSRRALLIGTVAWPFCALMGGVAGLIGSLSAPGTLEDGRLTAPAGYANASAALFLMGMWPAVILASRRELAAPLRIALTATAGVLGGLGLLTQSRGILLAFPVVAVVALMFSPGRLRLCVPLTMVVGVTGALANELIGVRSTWQAGDEPAAVWDAVGALVAIAAVLAVLGLAYTALDRRLEPSPRFMRRASLAARGGLVAAVLVGAVAFVAANGNPVAWGQDRWSDFKTPDYTRVETASTRFGGGLGSNRYDYWRASVELAGERPLTGTGADNFSAAYLERRRTLKAPLFAHSVWFSALGELGVPGLLGLAALVGALALALVRAWRRRVAALDRAVTVAAALPATYLLVHASGDFLASFPALVVPSLALAAGATAPAREALVARRGPRVVIAVVAIFIGLAVVPLYVSVRLMSRAAETAAQRPHGALADLDRAAAVNPLTAVAPLQKGIVALRLGRPQLAADALRLSVARDDRAWFAQLQLSLLAARGGGRERALELIDRASRLNPREPEIARARAGIVAGAAPDPLVVARRIVARGG